MVHNRKNRRGRIPIKPVIIILVLVPILIFGPAGKFGFVGWDDDIHVHNNRYLNPLTPENLLHFWRCPHEAMYIPMTFSAWALLGELSRAISPGGTAFGLNPSIFHYANLFFHICNVLLLFGLLKLLLGGDEKTSGRLEAAAGLGALLYGIHPLMAEPVIWISSLKDVLAGFFSLLALNLFIRYARAVARDRLFPGTFRNRRKRYATSSSIFFALALISKASAVPVLAIAWLLAQFRWRSSELTGRKSPLKALFHPPFVLLFLWAGMALPVSFLAKFSERNIQLGYVAPFFTRILIALDGIAFYVYKLLLPFNLGIDYGRTPARVIAEGWICYSWIFPVLLTGFCLLAKHRRRWLSILGAFVIGVLPTLGLVPHGYQAFSTVADRFLYVSMIAPSLALAWLFLRSRNRILDVGLVAIPFFCSILSFFQAKHWEGNTSLFRHAIRVNPHSHMAHYNLANALAEQNAPEEAIRHYRRALEIKPDYGWAHNNLGALLTKQGQPGEALRHYAAAFHLNPGNRQAYFNYYSACNDLGTLLAEKGDLAGARRYYGEAIRVKPDYVIAHNNLGITLAREGRNKEALECFFQALRLDPGYAPARKNLTWMQELLASEATGE